MEERTLVLEGLPDDLQQLRPKLELYFKNKRKSGGEVVQIKDHPENSRKALLVYLLETDLNNVLKQETHKINFKPHGDVELTVKCKEEKVEKPQPSPLPRPDADVQKAAAEVPKENEGNSKTKDLLISTMESVDESVLAMYFEQFTDKVEITKHAKNKWILKVDNHLDALMILSLKRHEFGVTVELFKEAGAADQWDPRRFVLSGFNDNVKSKFISVFIRRCSQMAAHTWEVIDEHRIVVTFDEAIDSKTFLERCAAKSLQGVEIEASRLELTDSVLVQGDMSKLTEDALNLYFSNNKRSGGGGIKSLLWVNRKNSVVISFQDCHAVQDVVEREHHFCGTHLSALLFYSSLQKALTGQTPTCPDIPTSTIIPVDEVLHKFIENDQMCKNDFENQLKEVHAKVIFDKTTSPGGITLEMAFDKESFAAIRLGASWESKAQRKAQGFLSNYSTAQFPAEAEVWRRVKEYCLGFVTTDAKVTYVESESKISIVGLNADVTPMLDKIRDRLKDATAELEKERSTVEKVIWFDSKQKLVLVESVVRNKVQNVVLTKNETTLTFHLQGLRDCVRTAEVVIKQAQEDVIFRQLNLSVESISFLKSLDLQKFEQNHFVTNQIPALFLDDGENLGIVAEKRHLDEAEDKVNKILHEEVIQLTADVNTAINTEDFNNFLNKIKVELGNNPQKFNIIHSEDQIVICGLTQVVDNISEKIKDYLENKVAATEYVYLKSSQEERFVDSCMKLSEVPEIRNHGVTVQSSRTLNPPRLEVKASKENIPAAVTAIKKLLSTICMEKHAYSKAGESKVILKHEANVQAKAKEWGCMAYISTLKTGPSKVYSHQINKSITLTATVGDLQHFPADTLVCPMTSKLAFDNPVAQRFLQIAGPDIQAVCNRLQKEKQTLLAGDVVLSNPGNLNADSLIFTVLPQKDQALTLSAHYLTSAILNSLQKAESQNHISIAMPLMGCGTFGFSIKESCGALREAILQLSNDQLNSLKHIKNIFVVDSDVKKLEEFNSVIAQMGFCNVKASAESTTTTTTTPQTPKQASDTEVTLHGVLVSIKKEDIIKETVDVIVNSNNKALDLNTGVSGAILKAAGQSVVDECQKHGKQNDNGVVLTSGGNLSCKHIAQMVGPGNVTDVTLSVEKVLTLCETVAAATVAIPAIGTGRGGIMAKDSIGAILTGVENHLTRETSSSLRKITVVTLDQTIFDGYRSYCTQRNNKTAPTTVPANKGKIEDVWIELKKGNIVNESVGAIVNTTNDEMNLMGGVSGAIFKAAGPSVQQECQKHGPLQKDTVAVTGAGNLQCDFIIHMMGPHSFAEAKLRVKKVLERCEEKQITTVSFPAVGTGGGKLNSLDAITAMLQGFHDHLSQCSSTVLKLIYVVIDRDEVLNSFQKGLGCWIANSQDIDGTEESEDDDCGETTVGPIQVKVVCGDITKETTDAIVSSTNTSLNLRSGVSGAILKAAGQTVVDECQKLGAQPSDGVVLTTAGNLSFKHIVHMVGQTKEREITSCMYKVLKKCEENQIRSVSFPALGTGAGQLSAACVATAMMNALANFSIDSPAFLKTVHIVVFQSTMLSDFKGAVKKFKRTSQKPPAAHRQTSSNATKPRFRLAAELAALTFPVTNVEVYGTSSSNMAKVKKFLDDLVSEECTSKEVQSAYITKFPDDDNKAIVKLSQSNQVHVLAAVKGKLVVSGRKEDVLDTVLHINRFIQAVQQMENQEIEENRLSKILHWDVAEGENWRPVNSSISYKLEIAFQKKEHAFSYKDKDETFTVNFKEMKRENTKGESCKVKRTLIADSDTAIIQHPPTWTKMYGIDLEIILLPADSEEYKKVESDFLRSSKHKDVAPVQVVQIQRIQSQSQWQRYCVLKQAVDRKYPNKNNETFLYHGTTKDICQKINMNGFNRSFCGRNAVVHGNGTYFAKEAWYSCHDQYSNPDENGLKYIYRARVVTGSPCQSCRGMKEPEPLDKNNPHAGLYDCAVDNLQNPFIFVVFCDAGAYPDYLISFKKA